MYYWTYKEPSSWHEMTWTLKHQIQCKCTLHDAYFHSHIYQIKTQIIFVDVISAILPLFPSVLVTGGGLHLASKKACATNPRGSLPRFTWKMTNKMKEKECNIITVDPLCKTNNKEQMQQWTNCLKLITKPTKNWWVTCIQTRYGLRGRFTSDAWKCLILAWPA